jgi:hypothetical protein
VVINPLQLLAHQPSPTLTDGMADLQQSRAAAQKVPGVVVCVEADQIAVQHTQQELIPDRQDPINLTAGEGRVKEEANLYILSGIANFLSQHLGQQHQMVVVDPNEITILHVSCHSLRKQTVGLLVCLPRRLVKVNFAGVVMEEGP